VSWGQQDGWKQIEARVNIFDKINSDPLFSGVKTRLKRFNLFKIDELLDWRFYYIGKYMLISTFLRSID
jgi:hypothetical protein